MLTRRCRRQVRSLSIPAGGLAIKIDEGLKTFWDVVEHMQQPRPTSTNSSGRGDHLPKSPGDRELAAPSVPGHVRYRGRRPDVTVASESPSDPDQQLPRLEQPHQRPYLSIFGEVAKSATTGRAGGMRKAP